MMNQAGLADHDKMLRTEIVESQKSQADLWKWKLIAVAAVASAAVGLGSSRTVENASLLACLIPLICAYTDLLSLHISLRIRTIGCYLKCMRNDPYEQFLSEARSSPNHHPFFFEAMAIHGSSFVFSGILVVLGIVQNNRGDGAWWAYVIAGTVGALWTGLSIRFCQQRVTRVEEAASERAKANSITPTMRVLENGPESSEMLTEQDFVDSSYPSFPRGY